MLKLIWNDKFCHFLPYYLIDRTVIFVRFSYLAYYHKACCVWGKLSPGHLILGHIVSRIYRLWNILMSGYVAFWHIVSQGILSKGYIWTLDILFVGQVVSRAYCLTSYCLLGTLCPGQIVLEHHAPPPIFEKVFF